MRLTGLEPARRETLDPKSSASTNSATGADSTKSIPDKEATEVDLAAAKLAKNYELTKSFRAFSMISSMFLCADSSVSPTSTSGSIPNSVCWRSLSYIGQAE